jgi:hypothetical protein
MRSNRFSPVQPPCVAVALLIMLLTYCREDNGRSVVTRTVVLIQLMPSLIDFALGLVTLNLLRTLPRSGEVSGHERPAFAGAAGTARRSLTPLPQPRPSPPPLLWKYAPPEALANCQPRRHCTEGKLLPGRP